MLSKIILIEKANYSNVIFYNSLLASRILEYKQKSISIYYSAVKNQIDWIGDM